MSDAMDRHAQELQTQGYTIVHDVLTLDEVEELLALRNDKRRDRARVRAVAERRMKEIDQKIAELLAMKKALAHLVHCCRGGASLECPIIEALDGAREAAR